MGIWQRALNALGIVPAAGLRQSALGRPAFAGESGSGISITPDNAMRVSAFYGCARTLSSSVSVLPLALYQRGEGETRRTAADHPLFKVLHDSPNANQTPLDFFENMMLHLLLAGDHLSIIHRRASDGALIALEPMAPQTIIRRTAAGAREYELNGEVFAEERVFHVMGFGGGPVRGLSIMGQAREALGLSIGADRSAGALYRNGLRPSGTFELPEFMKDAAQAEAVRSRLNEEYAGSANAGKAMILEGGMKFNPISLNAEDAQLLETRKFTVEEICRFFGVPPFMIGHTENSTSWGTGIEQQLLGFQKFTLTPWLRRIEQSVNKQLLRPEERASYFAEFNLEGLLRGDSKGRAEFYRTMTQMGAMTVNEVRSKENLPPIEGGDVARVQAQNVPLASAPVATEISQ